MKPTLSGKIPMRNDLTPYLTVRVEPSDMVQYVHDLMTTPARADAQWGRDTAISRAAQLRWTALNRAFGDARVSTWTTPQKRDQLHVPAALIAAAGVARLTLAEDEVVFDIPTLLDATLELCEPVGHA
jgi:hypothetical protein